MAKFVPRALRGRASEDREPAEESVAKREVAEEAAKGAEPEGEGDRPAKPRPRRRPQPRVEGTSRTGDAEDADPAQDAVPAAGDADSADGASRASDAEGAEDGGRDDDLEEPEPDEPDDEVAAADEDADERERPRRRRGARSPAGRKVVAPRARMSRRAREAEAAVARLRHTALAIGVWALIFAVLAGGAYYLKHSGEAAADADKRATSAAVAAAEAIFSYDYRTFDESVSNGLSFTTGDFRKEYRKTTKSLKATAVKEKAVVRANVKSVSVADRPAQCGENATECVEVLLFVNQFRKNVNIKGEKVDQNRVILTMARVPDGETGEPTWLVRKALAV